MDKRKAYGIDKVTKEDYERNLEENLANLVRPVSYTHLDVYKRQVAE